jgi:hypothetical protein
VAVKRQRVNVGGEVSGNGGGGGCGDDDDDGDDVHHLHHTDILNTVVIWCDSCPD